MTSIITEALPFQSDLEEVLAQPAPPGLRLTMQLVAGFFASILIISAFVKTDIVALGRGTLAADAPTIYLQPIERAVVHDLRVRAGDHVTRGEILATFDPTFTEADLATLTHQVATEAAKVGRLEAELSPAQPASISAVTEEDGAQAQLYASRRHEFFTRLDGFDQSIARDSAARTTLRNSEAATARQLAIAQDVAKTRGALLHDAVGSRLQYLQAESSQIEAEKSLRNIADRLVELTHTIAATAADRQSFIAQWQRSAMEDLIAAKATQVRLAGDIAKAARLHELITLTAPEDGVVLEVASRAPGAVLNQAEPLVTMIPDHAALTAEATINSSDIGSIATGDSVLIKVDAFPYQQHGMLKGVVRSIGEESFGAAQGQQGPAVHKVRITLRQTTLNNLPQGVRLIPGMTLSVEVNVGTRNLLAYFLYPVTQGFAESMREP